jgi:hypothetical protein
MHDVMNSIQELYSHEMPSQIRSFLKLKRDRPCGHSAHPSFDARPCDRMSGWHNDAGRQPNRMCCERRQGEVQGNRTAAACVLRLHEIEPVIPETPLRRRGC